MEKKELFNQLTIDEKISLFDGLNVWQTRPIDRFNIKSTWFSDGPHGIRKEIISDKNILGFNNVIKSICYPTSALVACSFDENIAFLQGKSIGCDAFNSDVDLILGPGINIKRHPFGGRNFEYFSEDPYLSGIMAKNYVLGAKSENVDCCLKHFCLNSQEANRFIYSSDCDLQTMFDMYLYPFYLAIQDTGVASIMSSYNQINGQYASENEFLLKDVLRDYFNFQGFVVTDWGALNDDFSSYKNGLNIVMPGNNNYIIKDIKKAFKNNLISKEEIDSASYPIFSFIFDHQIHDKSNFKYDLEKQYKNAYDIAKESIVLAKNNNDILPLKDNDKVAFIGDFNNHIHILGGGSSKINSAYTAQICEQLDKNKKQYLFKKGYDIQTKSTNEELILEAVDVAKKVDKVILTLGLYDEDEAEGVDKITNKLPSYMYELFDKIYEVNKNIVVVLLSGSPIYLPFVNKVNGLIIAYLCGDMGAAAIVDILYGNVNPSGRLAESWPYDINDTYLKYNFPCQNKNVIYNEGIYVGYRYYESQNINVMFPFGYGLNYSKLDYSNFVLSDNKISFDIKNLSNRNCKQSIQIYVSDNINNLKQLKYFIKPEIDANSTKHIVIDVLDDFFKQFDLNKHQYLLKSGKYKIFVSISSKEDLYQFDYEIKNGVPLIKYDINLNIVPSKLKDNTIKGSFDMNSNLNNFKSTFLGRQFDKLLLSVFNKQYKRSKEEKENMIKSMFEMPFRGIISWANNKHLSMKNGQVILDILNGKYFKAIKSFFK